MGNKPRAWEPLLSSARDDRLDQRTHPMLIIGGILHENPFFIPPEEFLQELRTRRVADETPQ